VSSHYASRLTSLTGIDSAMVTSIIRAIMPRLSGPQQPAVSLGSVPCDSVAQQSSSIAARHARTGLGEGRPFRLGPFPALLFGILAAHDYLLHHLRARSGAKGYIRNQTSLKERCPA